MAAFSFGQIGRIFAVTAASVLVCGSLGSILALWREKTFQALALTMLLLILWFAGWRVVSLGMLGSHWLGLPTDTWAIAFSPLEAIFEASRPVHRGRSGTGIPRNTGQSVPGGRLGNGGAVERDGDCDGPRLEPGAGKPNVPRKVTSRTQSIWGPARIPTSRSALASVAETLPSATQPESIPAQPKPGASGKAELARYGTTPSSGARSSLGPTGEKCW